MFGNPSLITRTTIGKGIGFIFGLVGFVLLPFFLPDASWLLRWGILLWYTTVGAVIGVFGVFTWHPIVKLPMPWWIRSMWNWRVDEFRADVLCLQRHEGHHGA